MKFKIDSGIVATITAITLFILIMGYFMPVVDQPRGFWLEGSAT